MKSLLKITTTALISILLASCNATGGTSYWDALICGIFSGSLCKEPYTACTGSSCLLVASYNNNDELNIYTYQIGSDGKLKYMSGVSTGYANSGNPTTPIVTNESGTLAYVIAPESGAPGTITYTFNTKGVVPILTNTESTTQISGVSGVAPFQDNSYLAVSTDAYIRVINISESGVLSTESSYQEQKTSSYIAYGSNSEFVVTTDSFNLYSYDASQDFTNAESIEVLTDNYLSGIAINESGTFAYTINNNKSTVYTYSIDSSGNFSYESSVSVANSNPQGIALSPDGAYAYVQNNNKINVYSIGSNGYLTPVKDSVYLPGLSQNAEAITSYKAP